MKKILLILGLMATALGIQAEDGKLRVKMNCKPIGDSIVAILYGADDKELRLPFTGKQGVFDFEVPVARPSKMYIVEPQALRGKPAGIFLIPAIPGEEVLLTAEDYTRYDIDGSKFYSQYHVADILVENAQKEGKDETQVIYDFIKSHPDQECSAFLITHMDDLEKMKEAVGLLKPEVRNGRMKPLYQDMIDQMEAEMKAKEEAAKKQAAGIEAPEITLNDINGKPLTLSSLRGKYVILDFWGAWCVWCIRGVPKMKEYYSKYKGKFEILGIDCNDTEQKWKEAVEKHELPWLHVYNPKTSNVLADYGIQGFPTKIIIDPDGKIVRTIVGENPAFYTLLDDLFK